MDCPKLITPELLRRPANALNVEVGQAAPRCRLKTPEHWGDADPEATRWLRSGGSPLALGPCTPNACPLIAGSPPCRTPMSLYQNLIIELTKCTPEEAPLVEGFMRVTYSTLDGLDRKTFRREAKKGLETARQDPDLARDVARSYGLIRPPKTV